MTIHAKNSPSRLAHLNKCLQFQRSPDIGGKGSPSAARGINLADEIQQQLKAKVYFDSMLITRAAYLDAFDWYIEYSVQGPDDTSGIIDAIGFSGSKASVIEIKTGLPQPAAINNIQLAAYVRSVFYSLPEIEFIDGHLVHLDSKSWTSHKWFRSDIPELDDRINILITASNLSSNQDRTPGAHCAYCHRSAKCGKVLEHIGSKDDTSTYTGEEIVRIFTAFRTLDITKRRISQHILQHELSVPGVEIRTRKTNRVWNPNKKEEIAQLLSESLGSDVLLDAISPTDAERILKKKLSTDLLEELSYTRYVQYVGEI